MESCVWTRVALGCASRLRGRQCRVRGPSKGVFCLEKSIKLFFCQFSFALVCWLGWKAMCWGFILGDTLQDLFFRLEKQAVQNARLLLAVRLSYKKVESTSGVLQFSSALVQIRAYVYRLVYRGCILEGVLRAFFPCESRKGNWWYGPNPYKWWCCCPRSLNRLLLSTESFRTSVDGWICVPELYFRTASAFESCIGSQSTNHSLRMMLFRLRKSNWLVAVSLSALVRMERIVWGDSSW